MKPELWTNEQFEKALWKLQGLHVKVSIGDRNAMYIGRIVALLFAAGYGHNLNTDNREDTADMGKYDLLTFTGQLQRKSADVLKGDNTNPRGRALADAAAQLRLFLYENFSLSNGPYKGRRNGR